MTTASPQSPYPEASQSVTVFILGILSIVVCQVLGPFAWKMGTDELRAIREGRRTPENLGLAQAGRICGIVGTGLLALVVVFFLLWLVLFAFGVLGAFDDGFRPR
jgi:hypothetical protein